MKTAKTVKKPSEYLPITRKNGMFDFMKHIFTVLIAFAAFNLTACASNQQTAPSEIVELPQNATISRHDLPYTMTKDHNLDTSDLLTNANVIVYPIQGDIDQQKYQFPEYRGVLKNTTASGYTVFDQSVTVYAVDGVGAQPPSYMANYAVPTYVNEFQIVQNAPTAVKAQKLLPLRVGQPSQAISLDNSYTPPSSRGPRLTGYSATSAPMMDQSFQPRLTLGASTQGLNANATPRAPRLTGY